MKCCLCGADGHQLWNCPMRFGLVGLMLAILSGCAGQHFAASAPVVQDSGYSRIVLELGEGCAIAVEKYVLADPSSASLSKRLWDTCMIQNGGTL